MSLLSTARGRKPLATLYHQETAATRYWRITLPAKFLPGTVHDASRLTVTYRGDDKPLEFPDLSGDVGIVQYPGDKGSAVVCMAMEATGKKLFVEADDNYVDYGDPLWRQRAGWGDRISKQDPHTSEGHRWIVEHAHGAIVTTRALQQAYGELNDNVHVCRNSIDPSDWPEPSARDETFRIGWYAGNSHDRDAPQVRRALAWASRQPNVEVVNIGLNPAGWNFARKQVSWTNDFGVLRRELGKLDVGVCPLVATPLTKYRSDLKALEYAMGGAMPFVQRYEPYWEWYDRDIVRTCSTPDEWERQIKWAVANRDEVRARGQQARAYVLEHRTFRTEIDRWRHAIRGGEA